MSKYNGVFKILIYSQVFLLGISFYYFFKKEYDIVLLLNAITFTYIIAQLLIILKSEE